MVVVGVFVVVMLQVGVVIFVVEFAVFGGGGPVSSAEGVLHPQVQLSIALAKVRIKGG